MNSIANRSESNLESYDSFSFRFNCMIQIVLVKNCIESYESNRELYDSSNYACNKPLPLGIKFGAMGCSAMKMREWR